MKLQFKYIILFLITANLYADSDIQSKKISSFTAGNIIITSSGIVNDVSNDTTTYQPIITNNVITNTNININTNNVIETNSNTEQLISFNFDRIDIKNLTKIVGELTNKRFILPENIDNKVSVISPVNITLSEIYPLYLSVLESIGYAVVQNNNTYVIVALPKKDILNAPIITKDNSTTNAVNNDTGNIITRIIKVEYINVSDLKKTLESMVSGGKAGSLEIFKAGNVIIITDIASNVSKIEEIISILDKPGTIRNIEVVPLKNIAAEDIAKQLSAVTLGTSENKTLQQLNEQSDRPNIIASPQVNSIVLIGTDIQIKELKRIAQAMDSDNLANKGPLQAIFLKYLDAKTAGASLISLIDKTLAKDQQRRISIDINAEQNAILVSSSPRDFEWVRDLVDRLDKPPQQVMVEVVIAEVSMNNNYDFGVEMLSPQVAEDGKTTVFGRSRPGSIDTLTDKIANNKFSQGLSVGVAKGTYTLPNGTTIPLVPFLLTAAQQDESVKILANVPLWAQNNIEASVNICKNIPMLKSTVDVGGGTSMNTIQNIDRKEVGIKVKVTAHINPNKEITLQLKPSIEAIVDNGEEGKYTPTFATREVNTTVTVTNKATVILSGLIREDSIDSVGKVPLLGDIPYLGWLFKWTTNTKEKTNLMILVTPTIIDEDNNIDNINQLYDNRMKIGIETSNVVVTTHLNTKVEKIVEIKKKVQKQ